MKICKIYLILHLVVLSLSYVIHVGQALKDHRLQFCPTNLDHVIDHADFASICNLNAEDAKNRLLVRHKNILSVKKRALPTIGCQYYVISTSADENGIASQVVSIRGLSNLLNILSIFDTKLSLDEYLQINVHSGFKIIYNQIFNDLIEKFTFSSQDKFYITGHSMGGVAGILLAAALNRSNVIEVDGITVFGIPKVRYNIITSIYQFSYSFNIIYF